MASEEIVDTQTETALADAKGCENLKALSELMKLIATLRGVGGCPWDQKQTPESVSVYLLEEVYEFISAIESEDTAAINEELGDVLFQVLFLGHLYEEGNLFDLSEVAKKNRLKMIRRHPHVFGDETPSTAGDIKQRWAQIKAAEKEKAGTIDEAHDLPTNLPALLKACRYFDRMPDKPNPIDTLKSAKKAFKVLETRLAKPLHDDAASIEKATAQAAGEALLNLVHLVQRMGLHPETLLNQALQKQLIKM